MKLYTQKWFVPHHPTKLQNLLTSNPQHLPLHARTSQSHALHTRAQPQCSGVSSGGIAGIVIGTIAGTLLILWLLNSFRGGAREPSSELVGRDQGGSRRSGSHRSTSRRGSRRGSRTIYVDEKGNRVSPPARAHYRD